MDILMNIGALVLAFVCIITVLVILMQRPSANAGMGAALGGGAAESAFGGEAGNVLTKMTNTLIIVFLALAFGLFLGYKHTKPLNDTPAAKSDSLIKDLSKTETPAIAPAVEKSAPATTDPAPATAPTNPAETAPVLKDLEPMKPSAPATPAAPTDTAPSGPAK